MKNPTPLYSKTAMRRKTDANKGCDLGDLEVTVTSELHAQAERSKKGQRNRNEKRSLHPVVAQGKTQDRKMVLRHGGTRGSEDVRGAKLAGS